MFACYSLVYLVDVHRIRLECSELLRFFGLKAYRDCSLLAIMGINFWGSGELKNKRTAYVTSLCLLKTGAHPRKIIRERMCSRKSRGEGEGRGSDLKEVGKGRRLPK